MEETYYLKVKKQYANDVIEDLKMLDAIEVLQEPEIPEWQKEEVLRRLKALEENPELEISWEDAMKLIHEDTITRL
jgi:hypothetical protein